MYYVLVSILSKQLNDVLVLCGFLRADDPAKKPKTVVDVGCGIGGSSRYLANKYGAQCSGITLSPVQAERGNALAAAQGLSDKVAVNLCYRKKYPCGSTLQTLILISTAD